MPPARKSAARLPVCRPRHSQIAYQLSSRLSGYFLRRRHRDDHPHRRFYRVIAKSADNKYRAGSVVVEETAAASDSLAKLMCAHLFSDLRLHLDPSAGLKTVALDDQPAVRASGKFRGCTRTLQPVVLSNFWVVIMAGSPAPRPSRRKANAADELLYDRELN